MSEILIDPRVPAFALFEYYEDCLDENGDIRPFAKFIVHGRIEEKLSHRDVNGLIDLGIPVPEHPSYEDWMADQNRSRRSVFEFNAWLNEVRVSAQHACALERADRLARARAHGHRVFYGERL